MAYTATEKRATGRDWAKAITCSILLLLLLLFLLWPKQGAESAGGNGGGFGKLGAGAGGLGTGDGIGVGNGSGTGNSGSGAGSESSGEAGGGESDRKTRGGDAVADSTTTFGTNSKVTGGENANEVDSETDSRSQSPFDGDGTRGTADLPDQFSIEESDALLKETGNNTLAIIQPNAAPAAPATTANRFVGGAGKSGASGGTSPGKNIGGMTVQGGSLGVILDISGSMTSYLEDLREEIKMKFSDAVFLEVRGCTIRRSEFDKEDFLNSPPPDDNERYTVMDAMLELVEVYQVDAVYWFCDLQDSQQEDGLRQLRDLVWGKEMPPLTATNGRKSGDPGFDGLENLNELQKNVGGRPNAASVFRLYVRSTDETPGPKLKRIITESGGQFQKKR